MAAIPVPRPCLVAGAVRYSGGVNTGEVPFTTGGQVVATVYSGDILNPGSGFAVGRVLTGDQLLIFSGAGRINKVFLTRSVFTLSGPPLWFYDSAIVARSGAGPIESGYRAFGFNSPGGLSGQITQTGPYDLAFPFTSGLCASCVSGIVGFSVSYTPETNVPYGAP